MPKSAAAWRHSDSAVAPFCHFAAFAIMALASGRAVRYTLCLRESAFANVAQLVEQRTRNA